MADNDDGADLAAPAAALKRVTPKSGFNVVGDDEFAAQPGEGYHLVANKPTQAAAEKLMNELKTMHPDEKYLVIDVKGVAVAKTKASAWNADKGLAGTWKPG